MINALEHPLVADYLRELDTATAGLPAAVAGNWLSRSGHIRWKRCRRMPMRMR
jgi:hypothetical protein